MGGTSYQMATTSHTRTSIIVSYKECCLHQNISLPPSRLLWQWSTERISGQQFQHIHRTHMYRHREYSQFVSMKVFNKGRLIKLNPWSTSCLQFRNNLPVFHNISHYQLTRIMLKKNCWLFVWMLTCRWEECYQQVKEERKISPHPWQA